MRPWQPARLGLAAALGVLCLCGASGVRAQVTVYGPNGVIQQQALGVAETSTSAAAPALTSLPAFNSVQLQAPAVPNPAPPTQFGIGVPQSAQNAVGLSIQQQPGFYGFSIEFSVVDQVSE